MRVSKNQTVTAMVQCSHNQRCTGSTYHRASQFTYSLGGRCLSNQIFPRVGSLLGDLAWTITQSETWPKYGSYSDSLRQLAGNTKFERMQRENPYGKDGSEVIKKQKRKQRLQIDKRYIKSIRNSRAIYYEGPGMEEVVCHIEGCKFRLSFSCY